MIRLIRAAALAVVILGIPATSRANFLVFTATLNGPNDNTTSSGTGSALVSIDDVANTMRVQVTFSGLTSDTTASHIHAPTALPGTGTVGVATTLPTFTGFPLGVTSGTYDHTFDMTQLSSYNPSFVTANGGTPASAAAALFAAIDADKAYVNIHTTQYPAGEISGFLVPVPEPSSFVLAAIGVLGLGALGRARARSVRPRVSGV
jgi:CHRD domain/PEP-CTERM motif